MHLHGIAWASLRRRRGRFAYMLLAVVLSIGTVVTLLSLSAAMQMEVSDELDRFGANIVITPRSRALDLSYGSVALGGLTIDADELSVEDSARIRTIPNRANISAVAPKLVGTTQLAGAPVLLVGVDLTQEHGLKSWWEINGRPARAADEVVLGAEAATTTGNRAGDVIDLGGSRLQVVGTLAPNGSYDDQAVFADLAVVQRVLDRPGHLSVIEVSALCRGCPIEDIVEQIAAVLPHARVAPIRQAVAARERAVRQFTRFAYAVSGVVLLVAALVVLTTMMSAVVDRTGELGILRAVGFRRTQVARMVVFEALVVTAAGGVGGWLGGTVASRVLGPALFELASPVPPQVHLAVAAVAVAMAVGTIGAVYPAIRAANLDPGHALRHI